MKKIILTIILIISLSFFCGCQKKEEVEIRDNCIILSLSQNPNLTITQSVQYSLNSKYLNKVSSSLKEEFDFKRNLNKSLSELRKEFLLSFAIIYVENPQEEFKINKGVLLSEVAINEENDTIGFEIYFTSIGAWNYYHGIKDDDNIVEDKGNLFYKKNESKGIFPFSSVVKSSNGEKLAGNIYKERYISSAKGLSFEDKIKDDYKVQFIYSYSSLNKRLRSDANINFYQNGLNHHLWVVDEDNLTGENYITLTTFMIYYGWWLLFAIVIPLIFGGAIIIIIILNRKRKIKSTGKGVKKREREKGESIKNKCSGKTVKRENHKTYK